MQLIDNWSSCALVIGRGELTEKGEMTVIFESPNCLSCRAVLPPERVSSHRSSHCALELAVTTDQIVGRAIVAEPGLRLALELGNDALGQNLAEFDAPLIEGID